MKKTLALLLALVMLLSFGTVAFAADADTAAAAKEKITELQFNADGKFKIMQINDTQDIDRMNKRTKEFIRAAVAQEQPDLVVIPGDVINDIFLGATAKRVKNALRELGSLLDELQVPFAYTPGNHDHDQEDKVSIEEQMQVMAEFDYNIRNVCDVDPGTYNIPIKNSAGTAYALNVYMIDSQNKTGLANGYTGCKPEQTQWYVDKSNELKAENGGKVVPSFVFQHVPVKEIYQCLEQVDKRQANDAIFSLNDYKWYKVKDEYMVGDDNYVGEAPCSEVFDSESGEYAAWLQQGDIIGAFFAHDHVNNFVMQSDDGIIMGYNGGSGFKAYGNGDKRSIRMFEIDENDVANYNTYSVYYRDVTHHHFKYYVSDIMSTAIFGDVLRFLYRLVFITPWKGSR